MTYLRLPYDDAAPTTEMVSDATVAGRELHIPLQTYDDLGPEERELPDFLHLQVSPELAEMAAGLELHFD